MDMELVCLLRTPIQSICLGDLQIYTEFSMVFHHFSPKMLFNTLKIYLLPNSDFTNFLIHILYF